MVRQVRAQVSLCGILDRSGRDCTVPVPAGSPFNVCAKHMAQIAEHIRQAEAIAGTRYRLRSPCPGCGLTSTLVADVHTQTATCENCGEVVQGEPRTLPGTSARLERQPATSLPSDVVYYIRFGDRVKIGTTRNLATRLASLPHDEVLATESGGRDLEQRRHQQFGALRITPRGEWFRFEQPLVEHVRHLRTALQFERRRARRVDG